MDEFSYRFLTIQMNDPNDKAMIDEIAKALYNASSYTPLISYVEREKTESIQELVDYIFLVTIAIMMFLCFFSLSASMSANLYDQTKEIGILRATGVTKIRIKLLYFYEALVLVFAASLMGVLTGLIVSWTMKLQQDLFLNIHATYAFPWVQVIEIFVLSTLCAFFSTWGPTT